MSKRTSSSDTLTNQCMCTKQDVSEMRRDSTAVWKLRWFLTHTHGHQRASGAWDLRGPAAAAAATAPATTTALLEDGAGRDDGGLPHCGPPVPAGSGWPRCTPGRWGRWQRRWCQPSWMQAWQNACQHGSTAAGPSRGPKQMGQVSSRREILAAPSAAGSCLDASIAGAGSWCPVSCWRHLLSHLPLAGLDGCRQQDSKARVLLVGRGGSGSTGRTLAPQLLAALNVWRAVAGLDGLGAAHRTPRLARRWQYVTLAVLLRSPSEVKG